MAYNPSDFELVETPTGSAPPYNPADFDLVDDGQTGLIEGVGNSIKRGWTMSQMASEMEKPAPDPQRVAALQQEMQAVPPSDEYMTVMDDRRAPEESWTAFKSAPVKVLAELMGESFSAFAGQMIEKAPNRVAIGLGAGAAMGAPVAGIGAVPGGFIGAGAGFAEASGAASYSLEMAGGVLEAMEEAGVPLDNPEALGQALQDPQRMQLAREFAQRKAVPIAIFDGASAVIGGRMFGGGKVTSAMQRLGQGMAETFTQSAMGASGEASGQLAQSGEITSGRAILAEGVAEIPTGLVEIGAGQLSQAGANANQPAATTPAAAPAAAAPQPAPFTPPPAAETVVVEEVFGDPTTAAAEPVAATPDFDPSQDFEIVQEPSETIVTEPPAAPKIFRGVSPDVDYSSGDQFWSESREVAENYAAQTGTQGTIDEATPETLPKNLYTATDKPTLKDELELKNEPFAPEFDAEAKTVLQARGFEGIRYESGTDLGGEQAAEFHVFGKPKQQAAQQPAPMPVQEVAAPKRAASRPAPVAAPVSFVLPRELSRSAPRYGMATISFSSDLDRAAYVLANDAIKPSKAAPKFRAAVEEAGLSVSEVVEHGKKVKAAIKQEAGGGAAPRSQVNIRLPEVPFAATSDTPAKKSRTRIKKMTAQSGAIDLSIVEDLVEYGKTVYRAGMSFGKWAGEMVKEFGQGIASFLKQAFDRIVQAYKDSPYSDTTGAVGDVRPKAKPRQFEEKAKASEAFSDEAKAEMGSEYTPITLRGVAGEAKTWMAENGVEATERRILELNNEDTVPQPVDFALGMELAANLSATGEHRRAAAVVRTMSRRATSLGQTISVLAMLSRLTPDGIVFYTQGLVDQYVGSMPAETQATIKAAEEGITQLGGEVRTARTATANDTIINGTMGGEKVQERIKRRIPDKAQKQETNVGIRSVLTSQATKAEATKQVSQILQDKGMSASESDAVAKSITDRFYKVMDDARRALAANRKPAKGQKRVTFEKLMAQLKEGKITDDEYLSILASIAGVPAMTPELRKTLTDLANQFKSATDEDVRLVLGARLFEEAHSILPVDFWVKLRAVSYLSMLFAPKTWIRNLGGNQIMWMANVGRDSVVNVLDSARVAITGGKRTTSGVYIGTRIKALLTPIQDIKKGYDWNKQQNPTANFRENMAAGVEHLRVLSKLTTQNKFDITDVKDVGRRIFSSKFMKAWDGALSIALGGGDRGFWMSAFRASMAQREAAAKKNGEWTGRPTPEDIEASYADAMAAIYQDPNVISKSANRIRGALNRLSTFGRTDQFGLGTALIAFTQVPGSITLKGLINWSPLGMIGAIYESMRPVLFKTTNGRAGGAFRAEEFNRKLSEALLGSSGLYMAGYWLYAMGIVTASREEDGDLEAMRRASGLGAYRINVTAMKRLLLSGNIYEKQDNDEGDLILSYDWAQPLAITFAAGAELAAQVERNTRDGLKNSLGHKASMAAISLAAGAKSLEEQPLLSGLSSFMRSWAYSGPLDATVGTIAGIPSMFVPQLVRQANQLMDSRIRETRAGESVFRAFNQIAANTPGVADQFPARFDITGQAVERYQYGGNSVFNVLINPALTSVVKTDPALAEVTRLMDVTGETRQIPRQVGRRVAINGQQADLTNEQIAAYQYYVGNYTMAIFNWRMASPRYARLPEGAKVDMLASDLRDIHSATKSALFGEDVRNLTRRQRVMRANLVNSPLGQSMPPR